MATLLSYLDVVPMAFLIYVAIFVNFYAKFSGFLRPYTEKKKNNLAVNIFSRFFSLLSHFVLILLTEKYNNLIYKICRNQATIFMNSKTRYM